MKDIQQVTFGIPLLRKNGSYMLGSGWNVQMTPEFSLSVISNVINLASATMVKIHLCSCNFLYSQMHHFVTHTEISGQRCVRGQARRVFWNVRWMSEMIIFRVLRDGRSYASAFLHQDPYGKTTLSVNLLFGIQRPFADKPNMQTSEGLAGVKVSTARLTD